MQTFLYVQASEFALSPRSLLPLRVFPQGSRDPFRPGISCFVTSARSGYAIRPIQVIDGKRTFTFQDLQPCRLLQCLTIRTVSRVGIELRRASCRWRVTGLALSICETGAHFHHGHVSGGPPIIPDGRISQVRLETLAFFREPSRRRRGSSAGSHTPRLPWFAHSLASRPASALRRFYQAGHRTDKDTAKCPESLRPLPVLPP